MRATLAFNRLRKFNYLRKTLVCLKKQGDYSKFILKHPFPIDLKSLRNPTNEKAVVKNKTDTPHTPKE